MNAEQAIHAFWESFNLPAYDEYSVHEDAVLPYITYSFSYDTFGGTVPMSASVWYRSTSWLEVIAKAREIADSIGRSGKQLHTDNGCLWIMLDNPAYQRLGDEDKDIKRIYFNVWCDYITVNN